jgi:pilus assembly protein Flp/PilA
MDIIPALRLVTSIYTDILRKAGTAMKHHVCEFWSDTCGQDLVEYALAAGMVAVAAVAAMPALTTVVSNVFTRIGSIVANCVN